MFPSQNRPPQLMGNRYLPIFPLPLVLMPDEIQPLHIFEERYRAMLADVGNDDKLFGLHWSDAPDGDPPGSLAGTIGCAAFITHIDELPDGRSNIITVGATRYRLIDTIISNEPYLMAEVEFFEDDDEKSAELDLLAFDVADYFQRIATAASELRDQRTEPADWSQLPPAELSFLVAAAFNLESKTKYDFIKTVSPTQRLARLRRIMAENVKRIEEDANLKKKAGTNGHSKKKIDF